MVKKRSSLWISLKLRSGNDFCPQKKSIIKKKAPQFDELIMDFMIFVSED